MARVSNISAMEISTEANTRKTNLMALAAMCGKMVTNILANLLKD